VDRREPDGERPPSLRRFTQLHLLRLSSLRAALGEVAERLSVALDLAQRPLPRLCEPAGASGMLAIERYRSLLKFWSSDSPPPPPHELLDPSVVGAHGT